MANSNDAELVPWAREVRSMEHLQADPSVLAEIRSFFWSHEAESTRTATHSVLENFPDWWAKGRRAPCGLEISRQEDLEDLYRFAGVLFGLGIPLTLAERRTASFRLFQDMEVWGSRETAMCVDDLLTPEGALTRLIGTVLGEVFPGHGGFLDAAIYDATGLSQTKGIKKTSIRLVWPGIVVDSDRAARVRDLLVHRLAAATEEDTALGELEKRLRDLAAVNQWHSVFGDAAYASRSNVRMPLNDRVSPLPLRAPERRPFSPVGVMRFNIGNEAKSMKVEWLCRQAELENPEWIKIGCLRQNADVPLTEWVVPAWSGNQPIPPSSTRTGRVKVRTAGGSDGGGGLRLKNAKAAPLQPERAGQLLTIERCVSGTVEQFCEKMEQHLGKSSVEPDGALVWKQPQGDARVIMYSEDRRVKVVGRPNQVRSLVVIVAPYTEAQAGLGMTARTGPSTLPDGRMPSSAFAPLGADGQLGEQDGENETEGLAVVKRVVKQDFEVQGQGELALVEGNIVCITHDPEGEAGNDDRWVYGSNEANGDCGWFPFSHTHPLEV